MIEHFVWIKALGISVLERVLGDYITETIEKRTSPMDRTELLRQISEGVKETADLRDQVDALTEAVRELDILMRQGAPLRWKGDQLVIEQPRHTLRRRDASPERALAQLREAIEVRRGQLQSAVAATDTQGESDVVAQFPNVDLPNDQPSFRVPEPSQGQRAPKRLGPWGHRVVDLESDVKRQRNRARGED
jgi:hypothetical protein